MSVKAVPPQCFLYTYEKMYCNRLIVDVKENYLCKVSIIAAIIKLIYEKVELIRAQYY